MSWKQPASLEARTKAIKKLICNILSPNYKYKHYQI